MRPDRAGASEQHAKQADHREFYDPDLHSSSAFHIHHSVKAAAFDQVAAVSMNHQMPQVCLVAARPPVLLQGSYNKICIMNIGKPVLSGL